MALAGYPPATHLLGDLGIDVEVTSPTEATVRLAASPFITDAEGGVRAGILATLVDLVGGAVAVRVLRPDWMATADLSLQVVRPAVGPVVEARGSVLRKGRTTLVIEAEVTNVAEDGGPVPDADGQVGPVASATMTFAILPARDTTAVVEFTEEYPARWGFTGAGLDRPVVDALGMAITDAPAGRLTMPVHEYLHNSFGAVQGGVIALLADVAATASLNSATVADAGPVVVNGLQVAYLALGRVGPMESSAEVLRPAGPGAPGHAVVRLTDAGADHRLTTLVNVDARTARSRGATG